MNIIDCEQGSDEWLECRRGKITASNFGKVLAGGQGKTRKAYMYQVASEILTGTPAETYKNDAMEWGNEHEPAARSEYTFRTGHDVTQVGFVELDQHTGCSPDGMVGDEGLLEIKCPKTTTFIDYKISGGLPSTYRPQVQGQLWVCEREWCDFVVFDPRLTDGYFSTRVERDDKYIRELIVGVNKFVDELQELLSKFN